MTLLKRSIAFGTPMIRTPFPLSEQSCSRIYTTLSAVLRSLCVVLAGTLLTATTFAQAPGSKETNEMVAQAIVDLASNEFSVREQAAARLLAVGENALVVLRSAEQGSDPEVRSRAAEIRKTIEKSVFEKLSREFLRDNRPDADYGLPGWKAFSAIAGDRRPSKRLFLHLLERQRLVAECLEAVNGGEIASQVSADLPKEPHARLQMAALQAASQLRESIMSGKSIEEDGDVAALLLAAVEEPQIAFEVHSAIRYIIYRGRFSLMMREENNASALKKLIARWLLVAPDVYGEDALIIAMEYGIPEGLEVARRLSTKQIDQETRATCFQAIARFGSVSDVEILAKWIQDEAFIGEVVVYLPEPQEAAKEEESNTPGDGQGQGQPPARPGNLRERQERLVPKGLGQMRRGDPTGQNTVQNVCLLGDVALAAGLHLMQIDLRDHFPVILLDNKRVFMRDRVGFPVTKPEQRTAVKDLFMKRHEEQLKLQAQPK